MSTGYSFSPSLNQDTFNKWFGKKNNAQKTSDGKGDKQTQAQTDSINGQTKTSGGLLNGKKKDVGNYDKDGYLKNQIKWNLGLNYSFTYGYDFGRFNPKTLEYKYKLSHNLGMNGSIQPTKNWNFSFSTYYDFDAHRFSTMSCNLTRDLHCFSLTGTFIPLGPYKTYLVVLRVKSSMLQDLKYQQQGRSSSLDPEWP